MSNRTLAPGIQELLKNLLIALVGAASGLLTTIFGLRYWQSQNLVFFNYREESLVPGWPFLWLAVTVVLFMLGAWLGIWLVSCIKRPTARTLGQRVSVLRIIFPVLLILALYLLNYTGFPGVTAPAIARQKWATHEFTSYDLLVNSFRSCKPVLEKIGNIQFVAPTKGRNVIFEDLGSSGHHGELTLEVVGESGSGIANLNIQHPFGALMPNNMKFTRQGKVETLSCYDLSP